MTQAPENHVPGEVESLKEFGRQHATKIAIAVVVLALIIAVPSFLRAHRQAAQREASKLLNTWNDLGQLEEIVDRFGSSPTAPLALLQLAKALYDNGNFPLAEEKYNEFIISYGDHRFAPAAELGIAHCAEAQGQIQRAIYAFTSFATQYPDHFLKTQALFGQGRCHEYLNQLDEARIAYETIVASDPEGIWISRAEGALDRVNRNIAGGAATAPDQTASAAGFPAASRLPDIGL